MKLSHAVRQSAQRGILREEPAVTVKSLGFSGFRV